MPNYFSQVVTNSKSSSLPVSPHDIIYVFRNNLNANIKGSEFPTKYEIVYHNMKLPTNYVLHISQEGTYSFSYLHRYIITYLRTNFAL
jgi:hypothetical protein